MPREVRRIVTSRDAEGRWNLAFRDPAAGARAAAVDAKRAVRA